MKLSDNTIVCDYCMKVEKIGKLTSKNAREIFGNAISTSLLEQEKDETDLTKNYEITGFHIPYNFEDSQNYHLCTNCMLEISNRLILNREKSIEIKQQVDDSFLQIKSEKCTNQTGYSFIIYVDPEIYSKDSYTDRQARYEFICLNFLSLLKANLKKDNSIFVGIDDKALNRFKKNIKEEYGVLTGLYYATDELLKNRKEFLKTVLKVIMGEINFKVDEKYPILEKVAV